MSDLGPDDDRQQEIISVVVKFVGVALAIGLAIGLGSWLVIKSLDLSADESGTTGVVGPVQPLTELPTTALPDPTSTLPPLPGDTYTGGPDATDGPGSGDLLLDASPLTVSPMERINLTGRWPGKDAVSLLIQRQEDGRWVDFGVQTQLEVGTFATYVLTGREGDNKFRVYDPGSNTASNVVTITVK